ncbi:helix-turn-helix transcriptional regulator [Lentzea sp. NBRC 105346]|uniref:helix-turn-helix transcriptional regulator n=1 Tax=Lentzea sp. NBRC 105346 TaxID=3032205 RepID=UPI0024A43A33|nr:helix-turn-helix transcriptional regulator [Lentzea sp. NBRC 105346]GLZ35421.1 helix-turn-helix transcriptional regulator [Lentzea sp. NBRC 105346]
MPAHRLCRDVSADPHAPLVAAVVGQGGTGKSAMLDALATLYRSAGVQVAREYTEDTSAVLLVDDAHELDDPTLDNLRRLAVTREHRLVVAYRPWPRPSALSALGAVLGRCRPPVVLGRLDRLGVAARAEAVLGTPSESLVAFLFEQTDGMPTLVDRFIAALHDSGQVRDGDLTGPAVIPPSLVEQFRHTLDCLEPAVREVLVAKAVGVDAPACEGALATGLLTDTGALIPLARSAVLQLTPATQTRPMLARRAETAALDGDLDAALRFADQVIRTPDAPDRPRAVMVAAAVLARRGMLGRGADLYRWLGVPALGEHAFVAVPALLGTGALGEAQDVFLAGRCGPTLLGGAAQLVAEGLLDTVTGAPAAALSRLTRAAALLGPAGDTALLTDDPASLAAIAALHCGELAVAESVLGNDLFRHRLLRAWIVMLKGDLARSRAMLLSGPLEPRDELIAGALGVAIARRAGDAAALATAWGRAREAVLHHSVDLYMLFALGELAIGAARVGERAWTAAHVVDAERLLDDLGRPAFWAGPLHWSLLQAAIVAESPADANRYAALLTDPVLADAARVWLRVLACDIDPVAVSQAARGLWSSGRGWDGARLAGQAAIRCRDRATMSSLLGCARSLTPDPPAEASPGELLGTPLSGREREVAELVVTGLTYKQIGERLFISAKTVEHHVAKMRRRLGCATRSELFTHLRTLLMS